LAAGSGLRGGRSERAMLPRISSHRALVAGIVAFQALVLVVGSVLAYRSVRHRLARSVESLVLAHNAAVAEEFAELVSEIAGGKLEYGTEAWRLVQERVEALELAGGGFLCLLDDEGNVLCHPEMRHDPSIRSMNLGSKRLVGTGNSAGVGLDALEPGVTATGRLGMELDGTHYVAARELPELGARVLVHQPESALVSAGAEAVSPVLGVALPAGVLILSVTVGGTWLLVQRYRDRLESINASLEAEVRRRVDQGLSRRDAMIFGLAKLADYRDTDTGAHLDRICEYSALLARELAPTNDEIDDRWIESIRLAASLHDIGKVGIPDSVLLKPGRLDDTERRIIERHPLIGSDTMIAIRRRLGPDELLEMAIQICLHHHERWDGTGYPLGIAGEDIALSARIVALADVYDALTSDRVYKPAMGHDEASRIIVGDAGSHFDPRVVEAFVRVQGGFDRIRAAHQKPSEPGSGVERRAA